MNILDTIIQETAVRLAETKTLCPMAQLESRPAFSAPTISLETALREHDVAVIAEIKKASPSRGVIQPDFHPVSIARAYRFGGAVAISVLTEPKHFLGSLDILAQVRQNTDLPILRKDFIIDPYQLVEARAYGADAVLLIAAALTRGQIDDLIDAAAALNLECLVEVHDDSELDKIDLDRVSLIGVNNRNLKTFEVDTAQTLRVLDLLPTDKLVVSESGMKTAGQLAEFVRRGVGGFLIGETLMRSRQPQKTLTDLLDDASALLKGPVKFRRAV